MVTLGLDVSTTVAGIAFVDVDTNTILHAGFVDISNAVSFKDKANVIIDKIASYNCKFDRINLEASLSYCGPLMQKTVILLSRFNAVIEYIFTEHYKMKVNLINVSSARKHLFGKARLKNVSAKLYVKQQIESMFDVSSFVTRNRKNEPDKRMEDVYDAIVISMFK